MPLPLNQIDGMLRHNKVKCEFTNIIFEQTLHFELTIPPFDVITEYKVPHVWPIKP